MLQCRYPTGCPIHLAGLPLILPTRSFLFYWSWCIMASGYQGLCKSYGRAYLQSRYVVAQTMFFGWLDSNTPSAFCPRAKIRSHAAGGV